MVHKWRRTAVVGIAMALALGLFGCGSGSSGESGYSIPSQDASATGCPSSVNIGDQLTQTIHIRNGSGHDWGGLYVGLSNGGFTRDQFVDDAGNTGQDVGADQFRFPGLAAGASTTIHATFVANQAGNQKLDMQWWGSSTTSGISSDIPDTTVDLSCAIPVNP